MFFRSNKRRLMIAMVIAVAFVAIVVPTCRMVGCSMQMTGYMGFMPEAGLGIFSDCGGKYVSSDIPEALSASTMETLAFALIAMLAVAIVQRPIPVVQRIRSHSSDPPPAPTEPRGERFRV